MNQIILDFDEYCKASKELIAEGAVLLRNNTCKKSQKKALPYPKNTRLAVFGRIQNHYYKSGTGSGGMVNVANVVGIVDALNEFAHVIVDKELASLYAKWEEENPFEEGIGWGQEPWCQEEMCIDEKTARHFAEKNDAALIIIGRTAGEDKDNSAIEGSYLLTTKEKALIKNVRAAFDNVCVVFNVGNILDMEYFEEVQVDALLYGWHGGMLGGYGVAEILCGKTNPSGKLTDTIATSADAYPATKNFGDKKCAVYAEDIFVGYRYFETFAPQKVRYPFGFGLSYTSFALSNPAFLIEEKIDDTQNFSAQSGTDAKNCTAQNFTAQNCAPGVRLSINVTNTGDFTGKEVLQVYASCPQGALAKPVLVLVDFFKTPNLAPKQSYKKEFFINLKELASFDDSGKTGYKDAFVLEKGTYKFFVGTSIKDKIELGTVNLAKTIVTSQMREALYPIQSFERLTTGKQNQDGTYQMSYESVNASAPYNDLHRDQDLSIVEKKFGANATNFVDEKIDNILKNLTKEDCINLVRGEGMGSPKVTAGTAAAFGGVNEHLQNLGVACACCADGPSGLRLDSGNHAFSLPIGTLMASSFNTSLIEKLYYFTGLEMRYNNIDVLLAPGMNLHRHPLNGRNFEYYSEDPILTGKCASSVIRGLKNAGVTGSLKHFCANNQENGRTTVDSVVSARALREVYLKGFEIAVKDAGADVIMTTYGKVNGTYTASSYDLNTIILRNEWGFDGIVITDWWAQLNKQGAKASRTDFATMVRAQNDIYMVCPSSTENIHGDNIEKSLNDGTLTMQELKRNCKNIIAFLQNTNASCRLNGTAEQIVIKNRPLASTEAETKDIVYYDMHGTVTIALDKVIAKRGTSYSFALNADDVGKYTFALTARTKAGSVAQVPVSISVTNIPYISFTYNNTDGKWQTKTSKPLFLQKYSVVKLYFAQSGLEMRDITITLAK